MARVYYERSIAAGIADGGWRRAPRRSQVDWGRRHVALTMQAHPQRSRLERTPATPTQRTTLGACLSGSRQRQRAWWRLHSHPVPEW